MYNTKNLVRSCLLCVSLGLLSQVGYASDASPLAMFFPHKTVAPVFNRPLSTSAIKIKATAQNQWIDMGWPSTTAQQSGFISTDFDAQNNLYAVVMEYISNNFSNTFPDTFIARYSNNAWHTISNRYSSQGNAPIAVSIYNNKPYALFAHFLNLSHQQHCYSATLSVYQRNSGVNWTLVPNSSITLDPNMYVRGLLTLNRHGQLIYLEETKTKSLPVIANLLIYDIAHSAWKKVSVPLPSGDKVLYYSTDTAGNIYIEYVAIGDKELTKSSIEKYNITTGLWDTSIPSLEQAFPDDDFDDMLGSHRYHAGPANTLYSIVSTDDHEIIYENTQDVWLKNNGINLPADAMYIFADASNDLYTLNYPSPPDLGPTYIGYYNNGVWQNLGSGTSTASIAPMFSDNFVTTYQNTIYVGGIEKATGAPTLLKTTVAGN